MWKNDKKKGMFVQLKHCEMSLKDGEHLFMKLHKSIWDTI